MWDVMSFIIGLFFGLMLMIVICWSAFTTRTFIFTGCTKDELQCRRVDYYNNPGQAIKEEGVSDQDILAVVDGKLIYRRVPKVNCRPSSNQDVQIYYPQQCQFTIDHDSGKKENFIGVNGFFESPYYTGMVGDTKIDVMTTNNCNPLRSSSHNVISGKPIAKWEA